MDIEQEARQMGWAPQEGFKGDPEKWVDAETFVERGRNIMPILKHNNTRLLGDIELLKGQINQLQAGLNESKESMVAFKAFSKEATEAQVAKARREILDNLKEAKQAGDVDAEVEAQAALSSFDTKQVTPTVAPAGPPPTPAAPALTPEVKEWMTENPWYGVDQERTGMATGVANRLRAEGSPLVGRAFLEAVRQVVEDRLGSGGAPAPQSKVEGSRGGGNAGSGRQDYAGLPADARAICDAQAKKFVGENKVFKTAKEWNSHFAAQFFKGN